MCIIIQAWKTLQIYMRWLIWVLAHVWCGRGVGKGYCGCKGIGGVGNKHKKNERADCTLKLYKDWITPFIYVKWIIKTIILLKIYSNENEEKWKKKMSVEWQWWYIHRYWRNGKNYNKSELMACQETETTVILTENTIYRIVN